MFEFYPYRTNDGSVGLYSPSDNDIYHSATGAVTEAYEKFILPSNLLDLISNHAEINVLDICYGIGYNSKSFLNFILNLKEKNFLKILKLYAKTLSPYIYKIGDDNVNNYNDKIYSDKKVNRLNNNYICTIDGNNNLDEFFDNAYKNNHDEVYIFKNKKFYIKAIDSNKMLCLLSPIINQNIKKNSKNTKLNFEYKNIEKILNNENKSNNENEIINYLLKHNNSKEVGLFLYDTIKNKVIKNNELIELLSIITAKNNSMYFDTKLTRLFRLFIKSKVKLYPLDRFYAFLHNIYYKYLTTRYKNGLNTLKTLNINLDIEFNDARYSIYNDNNTYNLIFLDAFTPSKCPCLWTLDFFKVLYDHLSQDGLILTYSTATPVRNAMMSSGFFVGNIINTLNNKNIGTVAAKNKDLILHELSELDLRLIKSKSGIFYRDENLNASNNEILSLRNEQVKLSSLPSASSIKKMYQDKNIL